MAYRVELTERAARNLRRIYLSINAGHVELTRAWFNGLEAAVSSLDEHPARGAHIPEDGRFRQVLYGRKRHQYRIIYAIEEADHIVTVVTIRHGSRDAFAPEEADD